MSGPEPVLRVARALPCTEAEGPFRRFALWVQGCSLACPGCCNPDLFDPSRGRIMDADELAHALANARAKLQIEGLTVVGGEPLEQMDGVTALAARARALGLGVIVYTGLTWARARARAGFSALAPQVDTLVAGPFDRTQPETERAFVGSTNQELLHLSPRYAAPELWRGPREAEVRLSPAGELLAVGMPRAVARTLGVLRGGPPTPAGDLTSDSRRRGQPAPRRA